MKNPNIIVILTDDQRFDTINALGNKEISTPNFDRLVHKGLAFTHGHIMGGTIGAVCCPSRNMLMTGRTLFHLHGDTIPEKGRVIPPEHITMPEFFGREGYQTYHVGKWHQDKASFNRSFENGASIFGFHRPGPGYAGNGGHWNMMVHDYDETGTYAFEDLFVVDDNGKKVPSTFGGGGVHSSNLIADGAVEFLEKKRDDDRPFFLYTAFVAPHDPRESPNEFEAMYEAKDISVPLNFMPEHPFDNGDLYIRDEQLEGFPRREHAVCRHIADYYAMISHLDQQIGRILDSLDAIGEADNTIVVLAGDNGLALGQHGLMGKQNMYEHSLRVPLIMAGPGIPKGEKTDNLCYLLDIFPTLCEMTDREAPTSVEGVSFNNVVKDSTASSRDYLFCGYKDFQRCIRENRYKFIQYEIEGKVTYQLFDIVADPYECENLVDKPEYAEELERMKEKMLEERKTWDVIS